MINHPPWSQPCSIQDVHRALKKLISVPIPPYSLHLVLAVVQRKALHTGYPALCQSVTPTGWDLNVLQAALLLGCFQTGR